MYIVHCYCIQINVPAYPERYTLHTQLDPYTDEGNDELNTTAHEHNLEVWDIDEVEEVICQRSND